jgi:hypothetical protein
MAMAASTDHHDPEVKPLKALPPGPRVLWGYSGVFAGNLASVSLEKITKKPDNFLSGF